MSTITRDLWPSTLIAEDVLAPQEILEYQAEQLTRRMNDLLCGRVLRIESEDRVILGFDVVASRIDQTMRLFEVQHRVDVEYPVVIHPPEDDIPNFLKAKVTYLPSKGPYKAGSFAKLAELFPSVVENEWIASSPKEFTDKLAKVLASPSVISAIMSLLAKSQRTPAKPNPPDDHT